MFRFFSLKNTIVWSQIKEFMIVLVRVSSMLVDSSEEIIAS